MTTYNESITHSLGMDSTRSNKAELSESSAQTSNLSQQNSVFTTMPESGDQGVDLSQASSVQIDYLIEGSNGATFSDLGSESVIYPTTQEATFSDSYVIQCTYAILESEGVSFSEKNHVYVTRGCEDYQIDLDINKTISLTDGTYSIELVSPDFGNIQGVMPNTTIVQMLCGNNKTSSHNQSYRYGEMSFTRIRNYAALVTFLENTMGTLLTMVDYNNLESTIIIDSESIIFTYDSETADVSFRYVIVGSEAPYKGVPI